MEELITTMLLFLNSRLMLCSIFSDDFPKIKNLPKIFLRSLENVSHGCSAEDVEMSYVRLISCVCHK